MRRRFMFLLALALTLGGVTRADIGFTNFSSGGGCTADCTLTGTTTVDHLRSSGADPSCSVSGAGTGASCTATSNSDTAGRLAIVTGTTATANVTVTVTFAAAFSVDPVCIGQPTNVGGAGTWNAAVTVRVAGTSDATKCVWSVANTAAVADSTEYAFDFIAIGR